MTDYGVTRQAWEQWSGEPAPENFARLARIATIDVEEMLVGALYPCTADGAPALQADRDAIRDAILAQIEHRIEWGDDTQIAASAGTLTLGPLTLGGSGGSTSSGSGGVTGRSPLAQRILRNARLHPQVVDDV